MRRILLADSEHEQRDRLMAMLRDAAQAEVIDVHDPDELVARVKSGSYAAVFADGDFLGRDLSRVIDAVRAAMTRPMLVIASNARAEDLDPDCVSLVVRKPYEVQILTGILLSAVIGRTAPDVVSIDAKGAVDAT